MNDNWLRIERALSQQMSYTKKYETNKMRYYIVKGSSGRMYDVSIGEKTSCTCPDFSNNKNRCKHQILCLLGDFNISINNVILHSDRLSIELTDLMDLTSHFEGDECPICLDNIGINDRSWNCNQCQKYFHKFCIDRWLSLSMISTKRSTCPMCRSVVHCSR